MASFRLLLPLLLVPLAHPAPNRRQQAIEFGVTAGTTLVRTLENGYSIKLESMALSFNGEELPTDVLGVVDMQLDHSEHAVVTDVFEAVTGGRPERLVRTFDELSGKETGRYSQDGDDSTDESEYESELEKTSVVFAWDAEHEEFERSFVEGRSGPEELLEGLREDLDLRSLLPGHPVAEGDSWDVDPKVLNDLLDPGGDLGLREEGQEWSAADPMELQLRENTTGQFRATYRGVETVDGVRVARIALSVDTHSSGERTLDADELPDGSSGTDSTKTGYELEGELLWDLEHGHAHSLELSGKSELETSQSMHGEFEGETMEQVQTLALSGEMRITLQVERRGP